MDKQTQLFDAVCTLVIESIEDSTGFLNDRAIFEALRDRQDLPFAKIDLDSLSRFEIIMQRNRPSAPLPVSWLS